MRNQALRLAICAAAVAAAFGAAAPAAHAANIVPNGEFSSCTGGVPDQWTGINTTPLCNVGFGHGAGDTSSMDLGTEVGSTPNGGTARSVCVPASLPPGSYAASYAYNPSSGTPDVFFTVRLFSDAGCNTLQGNLTLYNRAVNPVDPAPGTWATVAGMLTTSQSGTQSVQFDLQITCGVGVNSCPGDISFDDVVFEDQPPTAVTFRSLYATRTPKGALVRWRTASEIGMLGFHVYREVNGRRVRVTGRLIAKGAGGRAYAFLDRRAPRGNGVRYWIQNVALDGTRSWHGPARLTR